MEIVSALLSFILLYKYAALFGLFFLASAGIPFPTITLMIATAVFASQGYFDIKLAILTMWLGSVAGDTSLYLIARAGEKRLLNHRLFRNHLERLTKSAFSRWFTQHPSLIIILSRFAGFSTISINILAGIVRFSLPRYLAIDALGEAFVTIFYMGLGYILGENWLTVVPLIEQSSSIIILTIILFLLWKMRGRWTTKKH